MPPEWEEISAVAMAVQNMWLACTALEIGAYWSSPSLINHLDEFFNFNEGESCLGFFIWENWMVNFIKEIENLLSMLK